MKDFRKKISAQLKTIVAMIDGGDILLTVGLCALCYGVFLRWGLDVALISGGTIIFIMGLAANIASAPTGRRPQ